VDDSRREQTRLDELTGGADTEPPESDGEDGQKAEGVDGGPDDSVSYRRPATVDDPVRETVELGVALLAHLESSMSLGETVDRIETVTTDPALTREILDTAEMRGVIDREDRLVRVQSGVFVSFERDVVRREGEFTCQRCGASLSTGHFVQFDAGEHGPFGSSCIRKVTGRE